MQASLNEIIKKNPELKELILPFSSSSKWARIACIWQEKKANTLLTHRYLSTVNCSTGEIYLDCTKKTIYMKLFLHTLARPFIVIFKTTYHALIPISLTHVIIKVLRKNRLSETPLAHSNLLKKCLVKSINSLTDIVRTPLYGIVMIITSLAALIIGPFAPQLLYDFREIEGKLIKCFYRKASDSFSVKDQFMCFQSIKNLNNLSTFNTKLYTSTEYASHDPLQIGLSNWASHLILFLRKDRAFIRGYQLLDPNTAYISASSKN